MEEERSTVKENTIEFENGIIINHLEEKKSDNEKPLENVTIDEEESKFALKMKYYLKISIPYILNIVCIGYFSYATYHYIYTEQNYCSDTQSAVKCGIRLCTGYGMLIILYTITYLSLFYFYILKPRCGKFLNKHLLTPIHSCWTNFTRSRIVTTLLYALVIIAIGIFLYFDTQNKPEKLVGLLAPLVFLVLGYVFSTNRKAIQWNTVIKGILGQFLLCLFCIRWEVGRNIFLCIGDKVTVFLNFALEGSVFVYGKTLIAESVFAFSVLPTIFFISFLVAILYHIGAMQWIILRLGWILSKLIGATMCSCVIAGANIFLGMSESSLLIQPYCDLLTRSEFHVIMVSGFSTVSGSVLAAYLSFGASASNLITSSVMAAPAAIGWAYLFWPETEEIKVTNKTIRLQKSDNSSLLEAAANGASIAIPIVLGIAANIVAIIAFVAFLNSIVAWLGVLVGLEDISFEYLLGKIFIPIAYAIGIPTEDCNIVGKVIASKTIINEFVAYERLGTYFSNGQIGNRSMSITTFAICGFANPSSIGILVGSLNVLAPNRRKDIAAAAFRSFIVGSIVCFVSASFAGILLPDEV